MKYWFPEHYAQVVQRLRVPLGFLLISAFLLLAEPGKVSLISGVPLAVLGIAVRAWAAGHLAKDQSLATGGPYAYVRNPLYLGTLLAAIGLTVSSGVWWLPVATAALFVLVYLPVMEREDDHLRKIFPGYREYAERVPMVIPFGARYDHSDGYGFRAALWWRNEEYRALVAFAMVLVFLAWRAGMIG